MRLGRSLDELGRTFSWLDLWALVKYARISLGHESVIGHVLENPPLDPATVPKVAELRSVSDRMAEARKLAAGQDTTPVRRGKSA